MPTSRLIAASIAALSLSGCTTAMNALNDTADNSVAAAPLDVKPADIAAQSATTATLPDRVAYLSSVVSDSMTKCNTFSDKLVLAEASVDTAGDVMATIASALGTVFVQTATIHAFTAASTMITGSKTAVDSDVFAKATVPALGTALKQTYFTDIANYNDGLANLTQPGASFDVGSEVNKIQAIHAECSLAAAEATVNQTLQQAGGSGVPGAPTGVAVAGGNKQVTVSFVAPASTGGSPISGYTATSNPGSITATGAGSPITVPGLVNGTAYTFTVTAKNNNGLGQASNPSSSVTPSAGSPEGLAGAQPATPPTPKSGTPPTVTPGRSMLGR
jgi:hypothetical protein